eukprot:scaffold361495_cov39-Prasinocladus_malaysianus.AAC.1
MTGGMATVWDLASMSYKHRMELSCGDSEEPSNVLVAISPDGRTVVTSYGSEQVQVWSAEDGQVLCSLPCRAPLQALELSPSGDHLVACSSNGS